VSGSRGFFYDDCRSGDRLAREYTLVNESGNFTTVQYYDAPFNTYQLSDSTGGTRSCELILMSMTPSGEFEVYFKFKKLASVLPNAGLVHLNYARRSSTERYYFSMSDNVYCYRVTAAGGFGTYYTYAALTNDVWYEFRIRLLNTKIMAKWWLLGTAEPNWIIDSNGTGSGGTERPMRHKRPPGSGNFALGMLSYAVTNYLRYRDIRITPVRKVGGL